MSDYMDEAHDRARFVAEHDIGFASVVGEEHLQAIAQAASAAYERAWDDAIGAMAGAPAEVVKQIRTALVAAKEEEA